MKLTILRLKPKAIDCLTIKKFDERNFLSDIQQKHFECTTNYVNETMKILYKNS